MPPQLVRREEDGVELSTLLWRLPRVSRCVSTAAIGGGVSECSWVVNAQVVKGYHRSDLDVHGAEIVAALGLAGTGVVMLTAVNVISHHTVEYDGAEVTATVGVSDPTWAADPNRDPQLASTSAGPGTVNVVATVPQPVAPGGLLNLIATVTEAKCQALADLAVPGTGTPSDAVTVLCPTSGTAEPFGGPRSLWGSRVACATYDAIVAGLRGERDRRRTSC
jgi:adenosylcobinamide amidohydrolase